MRFGRIWSIASSRGWGAFRTTRDWGNWRSLGSEVVEQIHQRIVTIAQEKKVVQGKRTRVDATVVVHYPTDSTLLGDSVRVLTRTGKKIAEVTGGMGTRLRNRVRNVQHRLIEIGRASRSKNAVGKEKLKQAYVRLMSSTERVVKQAPLRHGRLTPSPIFELRPIR